jgi:hypothetical protein
MMLSNLRFEVNKRPWITSSCTHLGFINDVTRLSEGCEACLALGDTWVHLRMCMTKTIVAWSATP